MTNLKTASNNELQQWAANAYETSVNSIGHHKARMNKVALARIIDELQARGLSQDISIEGIFNGKVPN